MPEFQHHFDEVGISGSFAMYDLRKNTYFYVYQEQNHQEYCPASTFKICNSLIGLETGVIKDENFVIPWDGIDRGYTSWNQDHSLATALKYSALWYYEELARRVGQERMQHWIDRCQYGNQQIGEKNETFWLSGSLKITPAQQIEFLIKLYHNALPFSARNQEIVKKIMIVEETDAYTLHAKTGWAYNNAVGWYVGYIEKGGNVYFFTTCIQGDESMDENFSMSRKEITRNILSELKIL